MRVNQESIQRLKCPDCIKEGVSTYTTHVAEAIGDHFVGMYIHGALARADFRPKASDVDTTTVSSVSCSNATLARVLVVHERLSIPIDATFVTQSHIEVDETPTPIDFLIKRMGTVVRLPEGRTDFIINRQDLYECGIALAGPSSSEVFRPVPWKTLAAALDGLCPFILPRFKSPELMLSRICYAFANRRLCSKREAGQWALGEFDERWRGMIESALRDHAEGVTSSRTPEEALGSFEQYCARYIAGPRVGTA